LLTSTATLCFAPDLVVAAMVCRPLPSLVVSSPAVNPAVLPGSPETTKVRSWVSRFRPLPQVPSPKL
jgi:hypothetical protein